MDMKMKLRLKKSDLTDVVKSVLIAVITCLVLVLAFAMIMKFAELPDSVILPVNIMIKCISVVTGVLFGIKAAEHGALKGFLTGLLFVIVTYLLFSIINGDFSLSLMSLVDIAIMIVQGVVTGVIVVNIKSRKAE